MFHIAIESTIFNSIPNLRSQLLKGECDLFPNLVGKKGGHFSMKVLEVLPFSIGYWIFSGAGFLSWPLFYLKIYFVLTDALIIINIYL